LEDAEADLLAFYAFPADHWPKLRSTNPWSGSTARLAGARTW
jgi:transposase-like protein